MDANLNIPADHWLGPNESYGLNHAMIPHWEGHLRKSLSAEPDPAVRFARWLDDLAAGKTTPGVRLIFIEQPYLGWAETVEEAIKTAERDLRATLAFEIANPE